jgi:hypothetical protein
MAIMSFLINNNSLFRKGFLTRNDKHFTTEEAAHIGTGNIINSHCWGG